MSEVIGFPGGGLRLTQSCSILCGFGDPNVSQTPDVQRGGLASLYLRQDTAQLYICSTAATFGIGGAILSVAAWAPLS